MKKFIECGVNLSDKMFKGTYNGKAKHQDDTLNVLNRAFNVGIEKIIILSDSLSGCCEVEKLLNLSDKLFMTVGCHPTNCNEMVDETNKYIGELRNITRDNYRVVAIGECGLDYDRENFCPREIQKPNFEKQVQLAVELQLPLYLHCRAAHEDLIIILQKYYKYLPHNRLGVVHTFDGTFEQAEQLLEMGFYLGINGCSLKSDENLQVVKKLPLDRLLIETDSPWCDVRPSHAGYKYVKTFMESNKKERWSGNCAVKGRNEPGNIIQIFEILCGIRTESPDEICDVLFSNSEKLFTRI
nr:TatD-like DNase [Dugesia japonica]